MAPNIDNGRCMTTDLIYWLMLHRAPGLGSRSFYKALRFFETPEQVFLASDKQRQSCGIFSSKTLQYFEQASKNLVEPDIKWQQQDCCHILTLLDSDYPSQLKNIADPPPVLYVRGNVRCLSSQQLAIVGSRNPTTGGAQNAQQFATELTHHGLVITSGMATGIDAKAHIGALESGGETIAVCGTGLDRVYPAKHRALAQQISQSGALVSEFPIGTPPMAQNFPRRNRVISGLSLGTLVVESSIKSGTMITAKLALDQGKEVFAVPSSIHNSLAKGPHQLIKQGAVLVESIEDILQELSLGVELTNTTHIYADEAKSVHKDASVLLKYLSYDALSIDTLVEKSGLDPQIVTQELLLLELSNKVEKTNGFQYALIK